MVKNNFYLIIGVFLLIGCTNNGVQTEVEPDVAEFTIGEFDQDLAEALVVEPVEYSLNLIEETEVFQSFSASIDVKEDGSEVSFNVWLFKEDGRQLITLNSKANLNMGFMIDQTVENRFGFFEGGDFRVPLLAEKGDIIKDNKILSRDFEGKIIDSDSLVWTQNENLFTAEIIRNQAYTPSGVKAFIAGSNYLPIRLSGKIGWIDFELIFKEANKLSSIKINEIVLSRD